MMIEDKYEYFILAYDSPTFSAAAAKVPMTSQGFTKIIKNLERDLGVPLFQPDENGKRKPTVYAEHYYQYAKKIQVARRQLGIVFERIRLEEAVDLKIACSVGVLGLFGVEVISGETYEHPQVNITYTEVSDAQCHSLVTNGSFDASITVEPVGEGMESVELVSFPLLVLVNKADPLSKKKSLTLEDLSGRKLAMPGRDSRINSNLLDACEEKGVSVPSIVEYAEILWAYEFVAANKGLGLSVPHVASLGIFSSPSDIVALPLDDMQWSIVFAYQQGHEMSAPMKDYLDELKRVAKRLQEDHKQ